MAEKKGLRYEVRKWILLNVAVFMQVFGIHVFQTPNGFATGGVSGIAILLRSALPILTQAEYMAIINILLLVVGIFVLGKDCGVKTIICTVLFSVEAKLLEMVLPITAPVTDQPFLELVYGILLTSIASAILFYYNTSTGGMDIVAMILARRSSLDVGKACFAVNALIAGATFFLFDVKVGLYSCLGLFAKSFVVDAVIEQFDVCKAFTIITSKPKEIEQYVMTTLHHGVTSYDARGEYTGEQKTVLLTVCRRMDAVRLQKHVKRADPAAFIIITTTSEIIGRGFRTM